jgi:gas vesicle protein
MSRDNNSKDSLLVLAGAVVGGAVGATLGLLFAPQSGKKTRKDIKEKAENVKDKIENEYAPKVADKLKENFDEAVSSLQETTEKLKNKVGDDKKKTSKSKKSKK